MMKTKASYSFEYRGRDGQTESILVPTHSPRPFDDIYRHAYQSRKFVGDEENNIPPTP